MRRGVESLEVLDVLYQAMLVKAQVDNSSCACRTSVVSRD
jgi:hypothetical protein